MRKRVLQVFGFLISTFGWFLVCCTLAMDYWRSAFIGDQGGSWIISAVWYWSTLWRDCYTDTTAVTNCRDYDVVWAVSPLSRTEQGYVQAVRGLVIFGMVQGFFAAIFCFVGMDCTYLGGQEKTKDKILLTGAIFHFVGGVSSAAGYSLFTSRLGRMIFTRLAERGVVRYEIGPPVYLGLSGSLCIILGSILYAVTVYRVIVPNRQMDNIEQRKSMATKTYVPLTRSRTLYNRDYAAQSRPVQQSSRSCSQLSNITPNKEISGRDSFV